MGARRRGGQRRHQEAAGDAERPRGRQGRRKPRHARGAAVRGPRPSGLGAVGPGVASRPPARLTRPYGPAAAAAELGAGGRLPRAEGLGVGASHSQQARGCRSYRGDLHPPQPWTGLHHRRPAPDAMLRGNDASRSGRTAAERKRRRRRRRCQPRAAAAPGGKGRRAAREERPERRLYGGPAGTRRLPRSPAGQRGAWRASCGAARRGAPAVYWDARSEHTGRPQGRADGTPGYRALASPTFRTAGRWGAKSLAVLEPQEHPRRSLRRTWFPPATRGLNFLRRCRKLLFLPNT